MSAAPYTFDVKLRRAPMSSGCALGTESLDVVLSGRGDHTTVRAVAELVISELSKAGTEVSFTVGTAEWSDSAVRPGTGSVR